MKPKLRLSACPACVLVFPGVWISLALILEFPGLNPISATGPSKGFPSMLQSMVFTPVPV